MKIIAIVGMPGSGKSIIFNRMQSKGFPGIRFGGIIIDEVRRRGWAVTSHNERLVREELRQQYGMDVCAQIALPFIRKELSSSHVTIDGLYSFSEYKILKKEFGDGLIILAVFTPKELRYQRLALRPERPLTRGEAEERDYMEIEKIEKGGPIALADFTLINDGTYEQLTQALDELLDTILS